MTSTDVTMIMTDCGHMHAVTAAQAAEMYWACGQAPCSGTLSMITERNVDPAGNLRLALAGAIAADAEQAAQSRPEPRPEPKPEPGPSANQWEGLRRFMADEMARAEAQAPSALMESYYRGTRSALHMALEYMAAADRANGRFAPDPLPAGRHHKPGRD